MTKKTVVRYGDEVEVHNCDPRSEHPDNERFLRECEEWFGRPVVRLASERYHDTWDVWTRRNMIVCGKTGFAPCTEELKRMPLEMAQRPGDIIVIGYTCDPLDLKRAARLRARNPGEIFEFPLIEAGLSHADCLGIIDRAGIEIPVMYRLGFKNNNCIGCPKGGMGYWNNIRRHFPEVFDRMAKLERKLGMAIIPDGKTGNRIFLDELSPDRGDMATEPEIECSIMCLLAEQDMAV
ncbi:MAG TPA: hypothetical protein VFW19_10515 [Allosphingosinicella sp.]|nr:hypothetical protein [Allosphingosinicella sp.]